MIGIIFNGIFGKTEFYKKLSNLNFIESKSLNKNIGMEYFKWIVKNTFFKFFNQREQYAWTVIGAEDSVGFSWVGNTVAEDESGFAAIFEEVDKRGADVISKAILADGLVTDAIKGVGFGGGFVGVIDGDLMEGFVDIDEGAFL